ncbi:hypothetical protein amrb99_96190 [Actinomadura sp. RB99]|nr:hypothetical protein [Actinomadura sp. RB99]
MDTAPRSETSMPGSSRPAYSDAEYTDAPASDTMILVSPRSGYRAIRSAASLSVSRDAVPLPMETRSTLCSRASFARVSIDSSHFRRGSCG